MAENSGVPAVSPKATVPAATGSAAPATVATAAKAAEPNPLWRMMGLPNFKPKLPSRNWLIFLSVTGSFAAAVIYDKQQTKRNQKKWCDLVSPLAEEHLPTTMLPRRMTIYLEAPPADGLRSAREHFHEYIKPVLVAAAMDWDVVEGRREGDVRYGTADRIRRFRRRKGEGEQVEDEEMDAKWVIEEMRARGGAQQFDGPAGDIVVGRHTWKEYIRGLHEGWLGPVDKPEISVVAEKSSNSVTMLEESKHVSGQHSLGDTLPQAAINIATSNTSDSTSTTTFDDDASPTATEPELVPDEPKPAEETKPKSKTKPAPYISTAAYASASLPSSFPSALAPATVLPFPHILGFWNFPYRIHRFLNRRYLADEVGRRTAAAVMASSRTYNESASGSELESEGHRAAWEQAGVLKHEELEWHKSYRNKERIEGEESVWLDGVVLDERIASRMRAFELTGDDEVEAERLFKSPRVVRDPWKKDDE